METETAARMHTHDLPNTSVKLSALIDNLDEETRSLRTKVKEATTHALETQAQAESQHLSHPSLIQRAPGATFANEPPGIHHAYWQLRSVIRDSQHKDEIALGVLKIVRSELVGKIAGVRHEMNAQNEGVLKEMKQLEDCIEGLESELRNLEKMVNSR